MDSKNLCRCGKKAVYYRKYEGSYLCRNHFIRSFEGKVKRTIRKGRMVKRGDRIAMALSGGMDSSALLWFMNKVFGKREDLELFAISVDEGIPGYRKKSLGIAKRLCKRLGIKHYIFSFKEAFGKTMEEKIKELGKSKKNDWEGKECTYCGIGRHWLINKKARELKATKVCFAMNLDDEIQDILMDYIRGDLVRLSRRGGEPILRHKDFVPRIKPFREIPEKEVGLYSILNGLEIHQSECPYLDGSRAETRKFLNDLEAKSPGMKFSVLKTCEQLLPCIGEVAKRGSIGMVKCKKCGEPSLQKVCKACELWGVK